MGGIPLWEGEGGAVEQLMPLRSLFGLPSIGLFGMSACAQVDSLQLMEMDLLEITEGVQRSCFWKAAHTDLCF